MARSRAATKRPNPVAASAESRTSDPSSLTSRSFWIAIAILELGVFLLHLKSLPMPHVEGDEVVFTFLAERLIQTPTAYHVQGSLNGEAARRFIQDAWQPRMAESVSHLSEASLIFMPGADERPHQVFDTKVYDRPLFFHPPLYPYSLALFRCVLGSAGGSILSAFFHALTVLFVALIGRWIASPAAALTASAFVAVEAVSWTAGERLWIDGMLAMSVCGAMVAAIWSAQHGGALRFILAGACLGLAGLTKLPAGFLAPAIVTLWLIAPRRPRVIEMIAFVIACLVIVAPWLVTSKIINGSFLASEFPTQWMMDRYPWVKAMVNRPLTYYIIGLLTASPILLYCLAAFKPVARNRMTWPVVVWAGTFFIGLTIIGASGMGFQLRYLAPALPALCLLAAIGVQSLPWTCRLPAIALAFYTLNVGIENASHAGFVDPLPTGLAEYLMSVLGWDIARTFPGMWQ